MVQTVFITDGLIDIRAFTTFGLNVKPNSNNPIGFFGTGLKYAIAVLMREKIPVKVHIGNKTYYFVVQHDEFREEDVEMISMSRRNLFNRQTLLPFTTELGKNWELWQAFRELYANTLDENGYVQITEGDYIPHQYQTRLIVGGDTFAEEYHKRYDTFLQDALKNRHDVDDPVQHFDRPSKYIYYRGIRIMDLEKPSSLTFNILRQIRLTEDRTAKFRHEVDGIIASYIATRTDKEFIKKAVQAAAESFEGKLDYTSNFYAAPSSEFLDVMTDLEKKNARVSASASTYAGWYRPKPPKVPGRADSVILKLESWINILGEPGALSQDPESEKELKTDLEEAVAVIKELKDD